MKSFIQRLLLLVAFIGFVSSANCQKNRPGYLITTEGDTISGLIKEVGRTKDADPVQHFMVTVKDEDTKKWETKEVSRYMVDRSYQSGKRDLKYFYAKVWPHNTQRVFISPNIDGKAQLYLVPDPEWEAHKDKANTVVYRVGPQKSDENIYYISLLRTEMIVRMDPNNYEIVLKGLFSGCPELVDQIGKKKFRFKNLDNIVTFYNEQCE